MKKSLKILTAIAVTSLIAFTGCDNGGGVDPEVPVKPADVPNLTIDGVEIPFSKI